MWQNMPFINLNFSFAKKKNFRSNPVADCKKKNHICKWHFLLFQDLLVQKNSAQNQRELSSLGKVIHSVFMNREGPDIFCLSFIYPMSGQKQRIPLFRKEVYLPKSLNYGHADKMLTAKQDGFPPSQVSAAHLDLFSNFFHL